MKCPHCGVEITPIDHNQRGPRCPSCWERVVVLEGPSAPEQTEDAESVEAVEPNVSPSARDLASEHNIDLASIEGSGAGGKIIKRDVEALL